ncbi:MAG: hypothetical protein LUI10_10420 [Lachnospiraceae bacterium]|nr:hypothetical protein [Lachnospiraceae bacterium]
MSERIIDLMKQYPEKKQELAVLQVQIKNFKGVTEDEVIDSMQFSSPQGERVQSSDISDKTARVAISYRERTKQINDEWYSYLVEQYTTLRDELEFFEFALTQLSGQLSGIMHDLVIGQCTWEQVMEHYHISRKTLWRYRQKAITELDRLYEMRDRQFDAYILN